MRIDRCRNPDHGNPTILSTTNVALFLLLAWTALPASGEPSDCNTAAGIEYQVLADPSVHAMDASELAAALKAKGISDLFVVWEGDNQGQIALGLFHQRANADAMLSRVSDLGFEARLAPRTRGGQCPDAAVLTDGTPMSDVAAAVTVAPRPAVKERVTDAPGGPATAPASAQGCGSTAETRYLVLADPADNGGDVQRLVQNLKIRGISNNFVITASRNQGKVALGIYDSASATRERVSELTALGFRVNSEALTVRHPSEGCDTAL